MGLGDHEVDVPERDDAQRDEPPGSDAAPVLEVPVVVGPHADEREILVLGLGEHLAAQPRERREAHRTQHPVGVHVVDPFADVPAPGAHLFETGRIDAVLVPRPTGDGIQADVRELPAVVHPDVVACVGAHDSGNVVAGPVLRRKMAIEHARGLDHVVIDTDEDEVFYLHGPTVSS